MKTAILVDGGFYRRRAYAAYGDRTPAERADELFSYCKRHLTSHGENSELSEQQAHYVLKNSILNKLLRGEIKIEDLTETDFLFRVAPHFFSLLLFFNNSKLNLLLFPFSCQGEREREREIWAP